MSCHYLILNMTPRIPKPLGDERRLAKVESWMDGLTIVEVSDFVDADGHRWRQLVLSDGSVVQMRHDFPWLILEGKP